MTFIVEAFFSGCISKVINDGKDYSWTKIKRVINDKNNRNLFTKIYRVIEKALNIVTDNNFRDTDRLYGAIEKIFIEFRDNGSTIESVKCGLELLGSDASDQRCERFLEKFYEGIRQDDDLYKEINMILQEKGIKIGQGGFQKLNETVESGFAELNRKVDKIDEQISISNKNDNEDNLPNKEPVKSRTQEYADKWNVNMFLNDFDKRDENAGVNVKLSEVYLDEHLPHYIWGENKNERSDLKDLLEEYIYMHNENKMLLVLGQPGIGKSTLITWIAANFTDRLDDILVYRFASDLKDTDWHKTRLAHRILEELGFEYNDLNGKTIILDGLDEVSIDNRRDILDELYGNLIFENHIKNFSLVITCRENYVQERDRVKSTYIILQPWDETQIRSFRNIFQEKAKNSISENTMEKIIESRDILGIPLILYMVLALNISIEKEGSIVDIYDKIFSLDGGIYDRCIENKKFENKHRITEIKEQIHQVSREIALWMFENNSEEAYIPQKEYQKICNYVIQAQKKNKEIEQDFLIGNFFKLVKHCEGVESEELYFVHRTIYEYFVAETIYNSIKNAMINLTDESQEELAGSIAPYLKQGVIDYTIGEYLKYKILKLYNQFNEDKQDLFYQWWESAVEKMMKMGMFYYTKNISNYVNTFAKETQCFNNIIEILHLISSTNRKHYILEDADQVLLMRYIKHSLVECRILYIDNMEIDNTEQMCGGFVLDLSKLHLMKADLEICNLSTIDLSEVNLKFGALRQANLEGANLRRTDLERANLEGANLAYADLTDANLIEADLRYANLAHACLTDAKLSNAQLVNAVLSEASLRDVDLTEANFSNADLIDCFLYDSDLREAKLIKTDLRGADLRYADLRGADLRYADLRGAKLEDTKLDNANLEGVIFDNSQVMYLEGEYNMQKIKVYVWETEELMSYEEYNKRQ